MALFIHCYAHQLNLVLTQRASKIKECKIFFAHFSGLAAFSSRSLRHTQLLDYICSCRLPCVAPMRWQYTWILVSNVFEKRGALKEPFYHILEHHVVYDEDPVLCWWNSMLAWMTLSFAFCLTPFMGILSTQSTFCGAKHWMYNSVCQVWMNSTKPFCRERDQFAQIWEATVHISGASSAQRDPRAYNHYL